MSQKNSRPTRELWWLVIFLLAFPVVAYISTLPMDRFRNEITEWGNRNSETYQQFAEYQRKFGINEFIVVTWPGCSLNDPRVEQVTERIQTELASDVKQISSGQQVYRDLRQRVGLSEKSAAKRLRNAGVGKDGNSTAVGFNLQEHARLDRDRVINRLNVILDECGVDPSSASFAGLGHNLYSLDREGLDSPFRMVPQIMLLALVLTIVLVRNFRLAIFINLLGTFTGCLSFNFVWLAGVDMNAIIWPLPTLTMLLTVSAALHFLSYFEKSKREYLAANDPSSANDEKQVSLVDRRAVTRVARREATKPVLCCTVTTALGLLSLVLSSSGPVRQFGYFGAISITAANCLMLLWLPSFLTLTGWGWTRQKPPLDKKANNRRQIWTGLAWVTDRLRIPIIAGSLVVMIALALGVPKIETGSNLQNFFPQKHQVLNEASNVEEAAGPLNSVELLLQFDNVDMKNDRLRVQGITALCSRIITDTPFESCISAATFAPVLKRRQNQLQKTLEISKLRILKEQMADLGLLHIDEKQETWRISCRYLVDKKINVPEVNEKLKSLVQQTFFREKKLVLSGESLHIIPTGEFVLFDFVDRQFFRELILTYTVAFAVISLIVMLVLRTPLAMLIALLPNLFPAVVVLGGTGHLGFRLDAASLMTASVALGIAVDDTLHFMLWWKKIRSGQMNDMANHSTFAIESTLSYCGTAILQTSLIIGASIVLYGLCGFLPTVRFGCLLSAMMFAALLGDLLLLPALLARTQLFEPNALSVKGDD